MIFVINQFQTKQSIQLSKILWKIDFLFFLKSSFFEWTIYIYIYIYIWERERMTMLMMGLYQCVLRYYDQQYEIMNKAIRHQFYVLPQSWDRKIRNMVWEHVLRGTVVTSHTQYIYILLAHQVEILSVRKKNCSVKVKLCLLGHEWTH